MTIHRENHDADAKTKNSPAIYRYFLGASTGFVMICAANAVQAKQIFTVQDLQNMQLNLAGSYTLANDIDASATATWNGGAGFVPVGTATSPFVGTFNGSGHVIVGLFINSTASAVGLFGVVGGTGTVENVDLAGGAIAGNTTSFANIGALVGFNYGTVNKCSASASVSGSDSLDDTSGGLVGANDGTVSNSYATGSIDSGNSGGLVGNNFGSISVSFATGNVAGGADGYRGAGGLVADNYGAIATSYATGTVSGTFGRIGGLAGFNDAGSIANTFAAGVVIANDGVNVGGLVGENAAAISDSYAIGQVSGSGTFTAGGLVGVADSGSSVVDGYWDVTATRQSISAGGTADTTAQLKAALPEGFSSATWTIVKGKTYPYLKTETVP